MWQRPCCMGDTPSGCLTIFARTKGLVKGVTGRDGSGPMCLDRAAHWAGMRHLERGLSVLRRIGSAEHVLGPPGLMPGYLQATVTRVACQAVNAPGLMVLPVLREAPVGRTCA